MLKNRVIPCLLLKNRGLVKTIRFQSPAYVGDPINAVKIFNDREADELVLLDIDATIEQRAPDFGFIESIVSEAFMPVGYGGGVGRIEYVHALFRLGVEKVIINSAAVTDTDFVKRAAEQFGDQSIVVSIDVKKRWFGQYEVFAESGTKRTRLNPVDHAVRIAESGAGEILLTSIDRDGTLQGMDLDLIRAVARRVRVPVVACGGVGRLEDVRDAIHLAGASAVAIGSLFVYFGKHRAVLINYPSSDEVARALGTAKKAGEV